MGGGVLCRLLSRFDEGKVTGMILIDLQKAYDTIDHKIRLERLIYLGFSEKTIDWF